jgi:hypothetical protein
MRKTRLRALPLAQQRDAGLVILQVGGWFSIGMTRIHRIARKTSPALGLLLLGAATVLLVPALTPYAGAERPRAWAAASRAWAVMNAAH